MPWLIEHNRPFLGDPQYLRVIVDSPHGGEIPLCRIDYDKDPSAAMRFARMEDAENFIYLHSGQCVNARATEHVFIDRA